MPFKGANEGQAMALILNGKRPTINVVPATPRTEGGFSPEVLPSDGVPMPVAQLIERCWDQDRNARPVFLQIVTLLEVAAKAMEAFRPTRTQ